MPRLALAAFCLAFLAPSPAHAALPFVKDDPKPRIELTIEGVDGALLENVRALSSLHRMAFSTELDAEMVGRLVQRAPGEAATALKPFGFYEPDVSTEFQETDGGWRVKVSIKPGTPVVLVDQQVGVTGPGRDEPFIRNALARSSLRNGERLSHPAYDQLKGDLLRAALGHGYLDAEFTDSRLLVDPATHTARARISL